jgi:hypothetical protein
LEEDHNHRITLFQLLLFFFAALKIMEAKSMPLPPPPQNKQTPAAANAALIAIIGIICRCLCSSQGRYN